MIKHSENYINVYLDNSFNSFQICWITHWFSRCIYIEHFLDRLKTPEQTTCYSLHWPQKHKTTYSTLTNIKMSKSCWTEFSFVHLHTVVSINVFWHVVSKWKFYIATPRQWWCHPFRQLQKSKIKYTLEYKETNFYILSILLLLTALKLTEWNSIIQLRIDTYTYTHLLKTITTALVLRFMAMCKRR